MPPLPVLFWIAPLTGLARRSYPEIPALPRKGRTQHLTPLARPEKNSPMQPDRVVCFTSHLAIKKRP